MFANRFNLVYVNGISKLNNIINIDKIFYNCISLSSIPDFKDWKIKKNNGYLMFYNCISFIFFPYERELNINKYDERFLGILITKYLKYNKEIIIILDGKDEYKELIACFKLEEKENEDEIP